MSRFRFAAGVITLATVSFTGVTVSAFFEWRFAEFFTNADGSVQFIELQSAGSTETSGSGAEFRSLSTGKVVALTSNLSGSTLNKSFLLATVGFGSLPGAVSPDFQTTPLPANFFNPAGDTITLRHHGLLIDSRTISSVPTDGVMSRVYPSNTLETNSPRNFSGQTGAIDLSLRPGDYNDDGTVDAADYVVWRKTDGGNSQGYADWRKNFGEGMGAGGGSAGASPSQIGVPEPATLVMLIFAAAGWHIRRRRVHKKYQQLNNA